MRVPRMTPNKSEILQMIGKRNPDGSCVDFCQIWKNLSYKPSREAANCTLNFLIKDGLVEKRPSEIRRGFKRAIYSLTSEGYIYFNNGV